MKIAKKRVALAFVLLFSTGLMVPPSADARGWWWSETVTICHEGTTIEVGPFWAFLHVLFHGDTRGECVFVPPITGGGGVL